MHKTIYVDVDEEITSIIDRVRAEEAAEIFLVVPKDAMLTQGVINLKLLKKEIDKIGKSVMIATSDPQVKKVIGRLGIKTKEMTGDIERQDHVEKRITKTEIKEEEISKKAADEVVEKVGQEEAPSKKQMDIGSESFFDSQSASSLSSEIDDKFMQTQQANQAIPSQQKQHSERSFSTSSGSPNVFQGEQLKNDLYARKNAETVKNKQQGIEPLVGPGAVQGIGQLQNQPKPQSQPQPQQQSQQQPQMRTQQQPNVPRRISVASGDPRRQDLFGNLQEEDHKIPTKNGFGFGKVTNESKAEKFFAKDNTLQKEQRKIKKEVKKENKSKSDSVKWKIAIPALFVLVVILAGGLWIYKNYPKVEISLYPKKEVVSKEIKIVAKDGASNDEMDEKIIPGIYVELTVGKSIEFDATGETFESDDGKARGKVTIYNKFSSSPQPLVKTTRVLSKEKKLFRLVNDETVPGMDGDDPGTVEVDVIADAPGEDFNITASTFTIEGFKGSPKYEKFEVTSNSAMTDGGSPDSNKKLSMVTQADLDAARKKTIETLDESLEQEISSQVEENMNIIIDSVEKEIVSAEASQQAQDVTKKFTYTVTQKVKAIAFSNEDVNFLVMKELEVDLEDGYIMDSVSKVVFKKGISDLEKKTVAMYVDAEVTAWPSIDKENISQGIVGKKEDEIKSFLSNYPEIEKVEITVKPSWLSTIPVSREKVKVIEMK